MAVVDERHAGQPPRREADQRRLVVVGVHHLDRARARSTSSSRSSSAASSTSFAARGPEPSARHPGMRGMRRTGSSARRARALGIGHDHRPRARARRRPCASCRTRQLRSLQRRERARRDDRHAIAPLAAGERRRIMRSASCAGRQVAERVQPPAQLGLVIVRRSDRARRPRGRRRRRSRLAPTPGSSARPSTRAPADPARCSTEGATSTIAASRGRASDDARPRRAPRGPPGGGCRSCRRPSRPRARGAREPAHAAPLARASSAGTDRSTRRRGRARARDRVPRSAAGPS